MSAWSYMCHLLCVMQLLYCTIVCPYMCGVGDNSFFSRKIKTYVLFTFSDETKTTPTPSTSLMSQKWIPPNDDTPLESEAYDVDEYINTDDEVGACVVNVLVGKTGLVP